VFESVTGLPYGFACALEFVSSERRQDAEAIFEALRQGWLALSGELADVAEVCAERWVALRRAARVLVTPDGDPYRQLEDELAAVVERLCRRRMRGKPARGRRSWRGLRSRGPA
jgi:hypothetical protein